MKKKIRPDKILFWILIFTIATVFVMIAFKPLAEAEAEATVSIPERVEPIYDVPLEPKLQAYIKELCDNYNVDMSLVIAIIGQESNYNPAMVGDNGNSIGLMQIQPQHHQTRMDRLGVTDLLDPYQNVTVGINLLAELLAEEKGFEWAVTAYNAGTNAADYNQTIGITNEYAESVLMLREEIKND